MENIETNEVMLANPKQASFDLLEDTITEILCRLPVKFIIRFTLVCKTWQALIKSPSFISKHLKQNLDPKSSRSLFVLSQDGFAKNYTMSLRSEDVPDTPLNLNFPFPGESTFLEIVGVSYGLVCVCQTWPDHDFVICNLSTKQYFNIPKPNNWTPLVRGHVAFGFTFDTHATDYKMIKLSRSYDVHNVLLEEKAWIYFMSTGSWREIDIPTPIGDDIMLHESSALAMTCSVFYWSFYHFKSYYPAILSFDLNDELFVVISVPEDLRYMSWSTSQYHLIGLKKELAFFVLTSEKVVNLWTLNANSVGWSMNFSIELVPIISTVVDFEDYFLRLVGHKNDGNLVFETLTDARVKLILFNFVRGDIKGLPFGEEGYFRRINWYTESLLPVEKSG